MGARCCQLMSIHKSKPVVSPYFFDSIPQKLVLAGFQMQTLFESEEVQRQKRIARLKQEVAKERGAFNHWDFVYQRKNFMISKVRILVGPYIGGISVTYSKRGQKVTLQHFASNKHIEAYQNLQTSLTKALRKGNMRKILPAPQTKLQEELPNISESFNNQFEELEASPRQGGGGQKQNKFEDQLPQEEELHSMEVKELSLSSNEHIDYLETTYSINGVHSLVLKTNLGKQLVVVGKKGHGPQKKELNLRLHNKAVVAFRGRMGEWLEELEVYVAIRLDVVDVNDIRHDSDLRLRIS